MENGAFSNDTTQPQEAAKTQVQSSLIYHHLKPGATRELWEKHGQNLTQMAKVDKISSTLMLKPKIFVLTKVAQPHVI